MSKKFLPINVVARKSEPSVVCLGLQQDRGGAGCLRPGGRKGFPGEELLELSHEGQGGVPQAGWVGRPTWRMSLGSGSRCRMHGCTW